MTEAKQPEALQIAEQLQFHGKPGSFHHAAAAELRRMHARIAELESARIAYASEFEPDTDGDPDVGNIHANIRVLKTQLSTIGAGGVEPLRRRGCLHQISEPAAQPAAGWWRQRADEIELEVAQGKSSAMRCYTDMRALLQAAAAPKPAPAAVAGPSELPTVPDSVLVYVQAYGDSRADDDGRSGLRIGELILALRRWAKSIAAAPTAQAAPQPAPIFGDEDHVLVPRGLLGAACSAIDKKRDGVKTLAELRRYTTGDLSKAAPQQDDQKPYAYAVYFPDQPAAELVHDLDELTDDMTNREHQITKLYAAPQEAPAAQRDAARYQSLVGYLIDDRYYLDDASEKELNEVIDAAMAAYRKQGGKI